MPISSILVTSLSFTSANIAAIISSSVGKGGPGKPRVNWAVTTTRAGGGGGGEKSTGNTPSGGGGDGLVV